MSINKKNKKKWQENIAIVPQSIYLNDSSILENITLGFDQNKIDKDRLFEILEICDLKSFVEQLPNNIYEKVGERGVRISGGQRQRIGIARALYRDANLIILDEPTNALDLITETKILNSLREKLKNKTLLFIMHSESSFRFFDHVINLNEINNKK